ncbi:hypothetical protein D3C72_2204270 [compost metagenome]
MVQFMGPEGDVVFGIGLMSEDDNVDQGHGIDVRVLQQGIGAVQRLLVTDFVARRIEHLKIIERFKLSTNMQRNRHDRTGRRAIACLLQCHGQGAAGHAAEVVKHGAGLAGVDG